MGVTNKRKETVCKQYGCYLNIIYYFGNKVILLKQLFEYAQELGLAKHYVEFHGQIQELVTAEILRQEPFVAFGKTTQLHMFTMRKYGIRYIEGKDSSQAVSAVPRANTNERILVSIFKNSYILDKIIPRLKMQGTEASYIAIAKLLMKDKSTILYNKNKGLDYIKNLEDTFIQKYFEVDELRYEIGIMERLRNNKNEGLKKGSESSEGKGKGKGASDVKNILEAVQQKYTELLDIESSQIIQSQKQRKLDNYNIDSMLNAYVYISQIKPVKGLLTITVLKFDINNKQDIYSVATQIASIYNMFNRYLNVDFKLKVGIVCIDEEAQHNIEAEAKKQIKDLISKENKGEQLKVTLNNWGVDEGRQEKVEFVYTNYNLTNKYLEGIKYSNLLRK